jgi:hypothetical protein
MNNNKYYYDMGQQDCFDNRIPKNGMPDAYYEGYAAQYAKEQQDSQGGSN